MSSVIINFGVEINN